MHNRLIVLTGIPGSGKSTWAKKFSDMKNSQGEKTYIVSADENRKLFGGDYQNFNNEREVWEKLYHDIRKYGEDPNVSYVIVDCTHVSNKSRLFYYKEYKKYYDVFHLVVFDIDYNRCSIQNLMRDKNKRVPKEVMEKMWHNWQKPNEKVCESFIVSYVEKGETI